MRKLGKRVTVQAPPREMLRAAEAAARAAKIGFGFFTCDANAYFVAHAAFTLHAHADIALVGGYAFPPSDKEAPDLPRAHVWTRVGEMYFDATWARAGWDVGQLTYFAKLERRLSEIEAPSHPGVLRLVEKAAIKDKIRLYS